MCHQLTTRSEYVQFMQRETEIKMVVWLPRNDKESKNDGKQDIMLKNLDTMSQFMATSKEVRYTLQFAYILCDADAYPDTTQLCGEEKILQLPTVRVYINDTAVHCTVGFDAVHLQYVIYKIGINAHELYIPQHSAKITYKTASTQRKEQHQLVHGTFLEYIKDAFIDHRKVCIPGSNSNIPFVGTYGKVYIGEYLTKKVAVKEIKFSSNRRDKHYTENAVRSFEGFVNEVLIMKRLSHENVVRFIGASQVGVNQVSIISEHCSRGNLAEVILSHRNEKEPILSVRWKMLYDMAVGLAYVHEHNVMHSDLKLDNIFVKEDYSCVVGDFGLSRVVSPVIGDRRAMCNPMYAARETLAFWMKLALDEALIARGFSFPSLKADVYAFALLFFQVILWEPFLQVMFEEVTSISFANNTTQYIKNLTKENLCTKESCLLKWFPQVVVEDVTSLFIPAIQRTTTKTIRMKESIIQAFTKHGIITELHDAVMDAFDAQPAKRPDMLTFAHLIKKQINHIQEVHSSTDVLLHEKHASSDTTTKSASTKDEVGAE